MILSPCHFLSCFFCHNRLYIMRRKKESRICPKQTKKNKQNKKTKDHWCSNTPRNDLCLGSRHCHCKSPADAQPLRFVFLRSGVIALNFCFSKHIFTGGYAQLVRQLSFYLLTSSLRPEGQPSKQKAGGEPAPAGGERAPALVSLHVRATAPTISPSSRAKRQTRRLPLFCSQPWCDAYGKTGGVPLNWRKE